MNRVVDLHRNVPQPNVATKCCSRSLRTVGQHGCNCCGATVVNFPNVLFVSIVYDPLREQEASIC